MTKNKISWENWNEKEKDHLENRRKKTNIHDVVPNSFDDDEDGVFFSFQQPTTIVTPFGMFSSDSMLKPSDRWDCWIGHTDFCITNWMANKLNKEVDGIASLNILDKYTLCVGIPRQFNSRTVIQNIEKAIVK